ncbi:MAG: hypothetical protein CMB53_05005 [Euryarchaeota archaeon]|nr:hypothetical protein [Euryarchaeota archaeon]|tara:strand:- start:14165 stop:14908 length:744 start_codon:yes stop_codon:yes gene_type:complete
MGGVLRWAKILSGCSFLLLLIAVLSASNALDDAEPYLDPEQFNVAFVEAGGSSSVDLTDDRYYLALRVADGDEEVPVELRLTDPDGVDCPWEKPGALSIDRQVSPDSPVYRTVRVFLPGESGVYTLHNDASEGTVWIVDDYAAQSEMLGSSSVLLMMFGCCFGVPFGLVALILAVIGWSRPKEDKVEVSAQVRIMTTEEIYNQHNEVSSPEEEVPGPWKNPETSSAGVDEVAEEEPVAESWENWDNG